jgi:hypothetical protein
MAMLDQIVTMDKSVVPSHQAAEQQWLGKGQPGPIKAKVHASRSKKMVLAFFDSNANYTVDAMGKFLKVFNQKRLVMEAGDWWFH